MAEGDHAHLTVPTLVPSSEKRSTTPPAPPTAVSDVPRMSSANTDSGVHGCLDMSLPARFQRYTAGSAPAATTLSPRSRNACSGADAANRDTHAPAAKLHIVTHPPPHPIPNQFSASSSATHPTHEPPPTAPPPRDRASSARHGSMTLVAFSERTSKMRTVPSSDPVTAWFAPGRAATQCKRSAWPRSTAAGASRPSRASQP